MSSSKLQEILEAVASGKIKASDAASLIPQGAARPAGELSFKVREKGAVSVYGLNARFPVTLYADQWERLFSAGARMEKFIKDNAAKLPRKADKAEAAAA